MAVAQRREKELRRRQNIDYCTAPRPFFYPCVQVCMAAYIHMYAHRMCSITHRPRPSQHTQQRSVSLSPTKCNSFSVATEIKPTDQPKASHLCLKQKGEFIIASRARVNAEEQKVSPLCPKTLPPPLFAFLITANVTRSKIVFILGVRSLARERARPFLLLTRR
jgi:hypothetical protein